MVPDDERLRRALRALATTGPNDDHPTAEELLEHHRGSLAESDADRLRAHLAQCQECSRIMLDLAAPIPLTGSSAEGEDPELDAAWKKLRPQLQRGAGSDPVEREEAVYAGASFDEPMPTVGVRAFRRSSALPWAAAAAIVFFLGSGLTALLWSGKSSQIRDLAARIERLDGELAELRRPRFGVPSLTLLPQGFLRDEGIQTLEVNSGSAFVVLVLAGADPLPGTRYRLEVVDASGAALWNGDDLTADSRGHFTLVVPLSHLSLGEVELRLIAPDGSPAIGYRLNRVE